MGNEEEAQAKRQARAARRLEQAAHDDAHDVRTLRLSAPPIYNFDCCADTPTQVLVGGGEDSGLGVCINHMKWMDGGCRFGSSIDRPKRLLEHVQHHK